MKKKMSKKEKLVLVIIVLCVTLIKANFLIPVHITGGYAGIDEIGYTNSADLSTSTDECCDQFQYEVLTSRYIAENIVTLIISSFAVWGFFYLKRLKKQS